MTINDLRFDVLQTFVDTVEGVSQPLQLPLLRFLRLKESQAEDVAQVETDAGVLVAVAAGAEEAAKFPLQAAISQKKSVIVIYSCLKNTRYGHYQVSK